MASFAIVPLDRPPTPGVLASAVLGPVRPSATIFFKRTLSWLALWIVALGFVYSGWDHGSLLLIALFGLAGQWEFYTAQEEKGYKVFKQSGLICGALLFANSWYFLILAPSHASLVHFGQELILVLAVLGAFVRLVIGQTQNPTPIATAALGLLGLLYVPFLFNFVALLAFSPGRPEDNRFLLVYLLAVTKFSDVGAYVIGSWLGRHKMIPRISPGKTWEGFAGAMLTSLGISLGLTYLWGQPVPGMSWEAAVALGLLLPLVSVIGDLAESVIKRDAAIKDSGHSIPGIGGALDLIDSILFTAPVLYFYLQFTRLWGE